VIIAVCSLTVFPAFILQAIAGVFALGARDSIAGTLMLSFAPPG
jgi:hypothetical protein